MKRIVNLGLANFYNVRLVRFSIIVFMQLM